MCIRDSNISSTIGNVFNVVYLAFGNAVSIIVGQLLGAGKMKEARETDTKLIAFSRFLLTGYYLDLYKLNNQVQVLQLSLIHI